MCINFIRPKHAIDVVSTVGDEEGRLFPFNEDVFGVDFDIFYIIGSVS